MLLFVNTAFSCLSTRSEQNSFEPTWRPGFISRLMPGDNCHLNGLAVRDGKVRYVTALGETDTPGGWRENKRDGGLLIDVGSNEIIARGLSMPHSPRWHRDRLWLLESGKGTFGWVDLASGRYEPVVELPGFTRGLSFGGPWAFIGLSQVRETAIFSRIPLVERLEERICGVWVVNIEMGQIAAFCRFEDAVQEIFAVEVLPGMQYPDLINHDADLIGSSYVLGDAALREVPDELRSS
ncbi:MAG: TIGR03032 family protein [Pirellulales bacterium]